MWEQQFSEFDLLISTVYYLDNTVNGRVFFFCEKSQKPFKTT